MWQRCEGLKQILTSIQIHRRQPRKKRKKMADSNREKCTGSKLALHSDFRGRASLREEVIDVELMPVRRSARLATIQSNEPNANAAALPVAGPSIRPGMRARAAAKLSLPLAPRFLAPGVVAGPRGDGSKGQDGGLGLRAVQSALDRSDRTVAQPVEADCEIKRQDRTANAGNTQNSNRVVIQTTGIRVLQLNMRRSEVVTGEVRTLIREKRLDILLLQEPYVQRPDERHTFFGLGTSVRVAAVRHEDPWSAVAVCNPELKIIFISQLSTAHCVCAEVLAPGFSFYVVSHYFQYSDDIEWHLNHLATVLNALRGQKVLVSLDSNARSSLWGAQETNDRGRKLERFILAHGVELLNDANQPPTFWTPRGESYIDITLGTPSMSQYVSDWRVRTDWSTSDHRALDIRLRVPKAAGSEQSSGPRRFNTRKADWERFDEILKTLSRDRLEVLDLNSAEDVERMATTLTEVLTNACSQSMPRRVRFRKSNPWWTAELTNMKKAVYRLMRAYRRETVEPERLVKLREYRSRLRNYNREVKKAKRESWRNFVTSYGNEEPWGFVYKHQNDKLHVEKVLSTIRFDDSTTMDMQQTASALLDTHVPDDREDDDTDWHRSQRRKVPNVPDNPDAAEFSEADLVETARTFKNGKAPGLDIIEVEVLKRACLAIPGQLVKLFNGCLLWSVFPSAWKEGSLRVLLKGEDKDEMNPKSYRPICLLSVVGKLLEKLIRKRLAVSIDNGQVSRRQFGFMQRKSTEDAIVELRKMVDAATERYTVALLFDIAGAFDNVWWPLVMRSLRERDCPANIYKIILSYFENRKVKLSWGVNSVEKRATKGCPQGSVLGPACWNLMFDTLLTFLDREFPNKFVAYADDLLVLVKGESRVELERNGKIVVDAIEAWCNQAKLQLAAQKTEAILLKTVWVRRPPVGRRGGDRPDRPRAQQKKPDLAKKYPTIKIGKDRRTIKFKNSVRYLGVYLDKEMGVKSHVSYLRDKVGSLFKKMGRLAKATWGLRHKALETVYKGVFVPTVAYAAAGWSDLCTAVETKILRSAQRLALIAVNNAYRTASWASLCVIAGARPIEILLKERREIYGIRVGIDARINNTDIPSTGANAVQRIREQGVNIWQADWDASTDGRITYSFFSDIRDRIAASWIRPDHYVTQVLSGHGDFNARLASMMLVDNENCDGCGVPDTVQHFLFECQVYEPQRVALLDVVGERAWPESAKHLVSSKDTFSVLANYCRETLWLKSQERLGNA